ncbi:MAG: hypothetical protein ACFFC7_12095 [Candidatus Hermodarchaeota archaeon]
MSFKDLGITHKKIESLLIASIRFDMQKREDMRPVLEKIFQQCKEHICGSAMGIRF